MPMVKMRMEDKDGDLQDICMDAETFAMTCAEFFAVHDITDVVAHLSVIVCSRLEDMRLFRESLGPAQDDTPGQTVARTALTVLIDAAETIERAEDAYRSATDGYDPDLTVVQDALRQAEA